MDSVNASRFFTVSVSTFGDLRVSLFAANRSLSQLVTSFIGSWCQGIHLMLLFAWTSFSRSITFVAMIDPWFSFFRIAWVSWTFWLSLLACKKVCIIAFLSRAVSNLPPFGEIVSHFRAYLTLYLERPIKCVVFICPQISVRFLLKTSIFTLIFLIRLSKISFCLHLCKLVGLDGLEPSTSRLSGARSNHLSYRPLFTHGYAVLSISSPSLFALS